MTFLTTAIRRLWYRRNPIVMRGHPAVFNRKSSDLGGFKYRLDPGAFRPAANAIWLKDCECGECRACQVRKQADQEG